MEWKRASSSGCRQHAHGHQHQTAHRADACSVAGAAGPHAAACHKQGVIVCNNSVVEGQQGSSMDFLMKMYLKHLPGSERVSCPSGLALAVDASP
jgi:hypothetical protein